ncbi:MAG: hypothetical protein RLZZ385_1628 [Pseudomonadota bacterium]|jgi:hypothetical protein
MKLSVCIPAYNRAAVLPALLDSILTQDHDNYEVVICEDGSPERDPIRGVAMAYHSRYPDRIVYRENEVNLGYDGNLRRLLETASGDFVVFMGNDDLMCPGALRHIDDVLTRHPAAAVYLRSYAAFEGTPDNVIQEFCYFDREIYFPPGAASIGTVYRRSVVIPGMTFHRQTALDLATNRFDGTLLYQLYLVAEMLVSHGAVFSPQRVSLYRNGGTPDFGNSASERGSFKPRERTPESSLTFVQGMLNIARWVEQQHSLPIYQAIERDLANYAYPLLSIQADKPIGTFFRYGQQLARMGFGRYPIYWLYFGAIALLGVRNTDRLIVWIKRRFGRTPVLGSVYQGER